MTDVRYDDPQAYRYYDHPRPGSIFRLLDIPQLVRGPTLVMLPSGKEIKVPRMARNEVKAPAEIHQSLQGQGKMEGLMKLLAGKLPGSKSVERPLSRELAITLAKTHRSQTTRA